MNFGIKVTSRPSLPRFLFEKEDMKEVGKEAEKTIRKRIKEARGLDDRPKTRLSLGYMARKHQAGKHLIRDLDLSGKLMSQFKSWKATRRKVRVGWSSAYGEFLAPLHNEPGLSPRNRIDILAALQRLLTKRLRLLSFFRKL